MDKETPQHRNTHSMQEQLIPSDVMCEGENGFFNAHNIYSKLIIAADL